MLRIVGKLLVCLALLFPLPLLADDDSPGILPLYDGSELIFDDQISFESIPLLVAEDEVQTLEGSLRRQWVRAPEERSPLEVMRNYEEALQAMGAEVLFRTREPQRVRIEGTRLRDFFATHRRDRGLATNVMSYHLFPRGFTEFLTGRLSLPTGEHYFMIAVGRGHSAARQDNQTFYELVTLRAAAMEMDKVSLDALRQGIALHGKVPVYNIHFETGSAALREDSLEALEVIAEYLRENTGQRFFVVGHTDSVGAYQMNRELSQARAASVVSRLSEAHGIDREQLEPVGVGPVAPEASNASEEGRAMNRRVEIVLR